MKEYSLDQVKVSICGKEVSDFVLIETPVIKRNGRGIKEHPATRLMTGYVRYEVPGLSPVVLWAGSAGQIMMEAAVGKTVKEAKLTWK